MQFNLMPPLMCFNHDASQALNQLCIEHLYQPRMWDVFNASYGQNDHPYLGWDHILDLIEKKKRLHTQMARPDLIAHAILCYRLVYKTHNGDGTLRSSLENAKDSADLFEECVTKKYEPDIMAPLDRHSVYAMIMATANPSALPRTQTFYKGFLQDRNLFVNMCRKRLAWEEKAFKSERTLKQFQDVGRKLLPIIRARSMRIAAAVGRLAASKHLTPLKRLSKFDKA